MTSLIGLKRGEVRYKMAQGGKWPGAGRSGGSKPSGGSGKATGGPNSKGTLSRMSKGGTVGGRVSKGGPELRKPAGSA
jgi:hypothetical protein